MSTQLVTSSPIEKELKKFNLNDKNIEALGKKYFPLKINGQEDKAGYQAVVTARKDVKNIRVGITKKSTELKEDAFKMQRAVNAEAKRLIDLLDPIEDYLSKLETGYEAEKERIKQEKEKAEQLRLQTRINELAAAGMVFDGAIYTLVSLTDPDLQPYKIDPFSVKTMTDPQFNDYLERTKARYVTNEAYREEEKRRQKEEADRIEQERLAEAAKAEELRKQEHEALEKARQEQAAERARLDAIAKEQAEKEAALIAAQKKLDDEKMAIEEQKRLAETVPAEAVVAPDKPEESRREVEKGVFKTNIKLNGFDDLVNIIKCDDGKWYVRSYSNEDESTILFFDIDLMDIITWVKNNKPELLTMED